MLLPHFKIKKYDGFDCWKTGFPVSWTNSLSGSFVAQSESQHSDSRIGDRSIVFGSEGMEFLPKGSAQVIIKTTVYLFFQYHLFVGRQINHVRVYYLQEEVGLGGEGHCDNSPD